MKCDSSARSRPDPAFIIRTGLGEAQFPVAIDAAQKQILRGFRRGLVAENHPGRSGSMDGKLSTPANVVSGSTSHCWLRSTPGQTTIATMAMMGIANAPSHRTSLLKFTGVEWLDRSVLSVSTTPIKRYPRFGTVAMYWGVAGLIAQGLAQLRNDSTDSVIADDLTTPQIGDELILADDLTWQFGEVDQHIHGERLNRANLVTRSQLVKVAVNDPFA